MLFSVHLRLCETSLASYPFKIRISPDVIAQEVLLGETVLLDVKRLVYFGLDELGTKLWRMLEQCPDADEAFSGLLASAGIPEEVLEKKFSGIINGLENSHIISREMKTG